MVSLWNRLERILNYAKREEEEENEKEIEREVKDFVKKVQERISKNEYVQLEMFDEERLPPLMVGKGWMGIQYGGGSSFIREVEKYLSEKIGLFSELLGKMTRYPEIVRIEVQEIDVNKFLQGDRSKVTDFLREEVTE